MPTENTLTPSSVTWDLRCPACIGALRVDGDHRQCPACGLDFPYRDGIWDFQTPSQKEAQRRFLKNYRAVRRSEGWGHRDAARYRALPEVEPDDPHAAIWRIRATSFRCVLHRVLSPMEADSAVPLRVLDLGAGNGWMSYQLARRGHSVMAVDLSRDAEDGLGAWRYFAPPGGPAPYLSVQASYQHLPLADGVADLILWNGSFHYAQDYSAVVSEALRLLSLSGRLAILDSPFYRKAASGRAMLAERQQRFREEHGFDEPSRAIGFLTPDHLTDLAAEFDLDWTRLRPAHRWRQDLRALKETWLGRREPARFDVHVARRRRIASDSY